MSILYLILFAIACFLGFIYGYFFGIGLKNVENYQSVWAMRGVELSTNVKKAIAKRKRRK